MTAEPRQIPAWLITLWRAILRYPVSWRRNTYKIESMPADAAIENERSILCTAAYPV